MEPVPTSGLKGVVRVCEGFLVNEFDVIVVGLGAMGSAAAFQLSRRGQRVLGLDRFHPPHTQGSSHGRSRIIREAYFEHPDYVPLVQRAYELWGDLEQLSGRRLFRRTGGLMIGSPGGVLVQGSLRSAREHGLAHEVLTAADLVQRYGIFQPDPSMLAVLEPRAGVLFPEEIISTHLDLAGRQGATFRFDERVVGWEAGDRGVTVSTERGKFTASRLLLSAGAWMNELLPGSTLPLSIERQVLCWFEPRAEREAWRGCPVYLWEYGAGNFFYGFPDLGDGVKVAVHHQGEPADPNAVRGEAREVDVSMLRELLRRFLPSAEGKLNSSAVCLYTNTPDENFVIDFHPRSRRVLVASPCSGHGFKFSSVVGEIAAQMLSGERPGVGIGLFSWG